MKPIILLASFLITALLTACSSSDRIVIGSKNFTEQVILGELFAQQIERRTGLEVDRRLNLGGTLVCHQAIVAGQIDIYPEYTGTGLTAILGEKPMSNSSQVYEKVKAEYASRFAVDWTEPLGFNNTFAIIVRAADAAKFNIRTISDSAPHTRDWTAGFGYEFMERPDGYRGLSQAYNLQFPDEPRVMDLGLTYRALADGQVDFIAGDSTAGLIASLGLAALEDDKSYFPPYDAAPVVRQETIAKHPEVREALRELGGKLSESAMRRLNYAVDGEHRDVAQVVSEFLDATFGK